MDPVDSALSTSPSHSHSHSIISCSLQRHFYRVFKGTPGFLPGAPHNMGATIIFMFDMSNVRSDMSDLIHSTCRTSTFDISDLTFDISNIKIIVAPILCGAPGKNPGVPLDTPHFYLAVDRLHFKMETLVDLLGIAGQSAWLPLVVCCSTRDELDAVFSAVSNLSHISVSALHSDQGEAERALVFEGFRQTTVNWSRLSVGVVDKDQEEVVGKSHMIIVTDACLPLLNAGESPISARVLINYELPSKKETYIRRMNTCLAADGIVINMVVGGEVVTLRSLEENSGLVIAEMPIHIFEMFSS